MTTCRLLTATDLDAADLDAAELEEELVAPPDDFDAAPAAVNQQEQSAPAPAALGGSGQIPVFNANEASRAAANGGPSNNAHDNHNQGMRNADTPDAGYVACCGDEQERVRVVSRYSIATFKYLLDSNSLKTRPRRRYVVRPFRSVCTPIARIHTDHATFVSLPYLVSCRSQQNVHWRLELGDDGRSVAMSAVAERDSRMNRWFARLLCAVWQG